MSRYEEVIGLGCFTLAEAAELVGSTAGAASLLHRYLKKGQVARVRRGLYASINPVDGQPATSRFQIASKIAAGAYVAYHSAFDYHGFANQVTSAVTVAVSSAFRAFTFDGVEYRSAHDSGSFGVMNTVEGVAVTDVERTVLDGIDGFAKDMGVEELTACLVLVPSLSEVRLLDYLGNYGKQFLYQKTGFFLSRLQTELGLSDDFFGVCQRNIGASKRYLLGPADEMSVAYDSRWRLVVPQEYL